MGVASRDVMDRTAGCLCSVDNAVMGASSSSSEADTAASSISEGSCVLSLSYSVAKAGAESEGSPGEALEPYLYEPVASDSSDDDDSQGSQRLLSTN